MNMFRENQLPVNEMQAVGLHDGEKLKVSDEIKDQLLKGQLTDFVTLEGVQVGDERINIDTKLSLQETQNGPEVFYHPIYAKEQHHDLLSEEEQKYFKSGINTKNISIYGKLIDYGEAPYKFDAKNKDSFYIKLERKNGEIKDVWGVDLKNALEASGHDIGEIIALSHLGIENVSAQIDVRDENDRIVGSKWINAKRNNWNIETYLPHKHKEKSVLFEYDKETKSYVGKDTENIKLPKEVNGMRLSKDQKKRYKEGQEVILEDGTKIQASPIKGMRFNRTILIASVLLDGGMTYFLLKATHKLQQHNAEKNKIYDNAYKNALNKIKAELERQHLAAPDNKQVMNDLDIVKKEVLKADLSMGEPENRQSINTLKENVYDLNLERDAGYKEDMSSKERTQEADSNEIKKEDSQRARSR